MVSLNFNKLTITKSVNKNLLKQSYQVNQQLDLDLDDLVAVHYLQNEHIDIKKSKYRYTNKPKILLIFTQNTR